MREDRRRAALTVWLHAGLFVLGLAWTAGADWLLGRIVLGPEPSFSWGELEALVADPVVGLPDDRDDPLVRFAERGRRGSSTPFLAAVALVSWAPIGYLAGRSLSGLRWIAWMPLTYVGLHVAASTWTWSGIRRFAGDSQLADNLERVTGAISAWGFAAILAVSLVSLYGFAYVGALRREKAPGREVQ